MCGRTVGRLRVVAERETTNLCVPSSSSSFSAPSSTSSSSSTRSSSLSLYLLRMSTGCFSLPLFLPTIPFIFLPPSLSPSYTLRLPLPAVHPLLSPFPFPSSVRRSLAHSLACLLAHSHSLTRSLVRSSSLPPCPSYLQALPSLSSPSPVSPVVSLCLSSLFVSLFHPFSPHPPFPLIVLSFFYVPLSPLTFFILLSLPPCPSLSLFLFLSRVLYFSFPSSLVGLALFCPPSLLCASPRTFHLQHPLRRYFELSFSFLSHSLSASLPFVPRSLVPPLSLQELTLWASFHPSTTPFTTAVENSSKNIYSTACNTSTVDGFGKKRTTAELEGRTIIVALNLD